MQGHTMYINCRRQGFKLTEEEAQKYCDDWANTFPEIKRYFSEIVSDGYIEDDAERAAAESSDETYDDGGDIISVFDITKQSASRQKSYKNSNLVGMWRVKSTRNAVLNFPFQSLAAVISKRALWLVYKDSLVQGYKITNFIHDEIIVECREEVANDVAKSVQKLMLQAAHEIIPEMLMKAEPAIMRRWSKDAEPAFDANGRLIPFEDAIEA